MAWIRDRFVVIMLLMSLVTFLAVSVLLFQMLGSDSRGSLHGIGSVLSESSAQDSGSLVAGGMQPGKQGKVHYFADGYSLSDPKDYNRQSTWVCIFNPTEKPAKVKLTFYYEDQNPTSMEYEAAPEASKNINLYNAKEVIRNKRFGGKIESSIPIIVQVTNGYYGMDDKKDWFTRAMHSVICADRTATENYYADGIVLDRKGSRLKEPEWAFMLNPNSEMAKVKLQLFYSDSDIDTHGFKIQPQRLLSVKLDDLVSKNNMFGARFISSVPIAVQQTRFVEEEDRKTIRSAFSVMAKPWTLEEIESK